MTSDKRRSLEELEGVVWGHAAAPDTGLVRTCHRLRTKPIGDFTVEDLRIMIGQQIGLRFLVPLALEVLEQDPLAEGDFYPGDLLRSLLRLDPAFWAGEWEFRDRVQGIVQRLSIVPAELQEPMSSFKAACGPTTR